MRPKRPVLLVLLALVPTLMGATVGTTTSPAEPLVAAAGGIHPGVRTYTDGGQCTANFVFRQTRIINEKKIREVFIGQAAHCASKEDNTSTNGCETEVHAPGIKVEIEGASTLGTMVYNSWHTMQKVGEDSSDACAANDFSLIKIHAADHGRVDPTVPVWGGPEGIGGATELGDEVYTYGNSSLRMGLQNDHFGTSLGTADAGWTHRVYTATPGVPGDSGSGFLDDSGDAIGVLSTVTLAPYPASNGVTDLKRAIAYMKAKTKTWDGVTLVKGERPFDNGNLP